MGETDRQTDKTSRWAFTAYADQYHLFTIVNELIAEIGWQKEICPGTQREHYQGYIRTARQVRFAQLKKIYPGVHIEPAKNWDALVKYCAKKDTAVEGTQQHFENKKTFMTMAQALTKLAAHCPYADRSKFMDMDEKQLIAHTKQQYWDCVQNILETSSDEIGLYSQPQYERAFLNTRRIWMEKCLDEAEWQETDRQTDILEGVPAFEN